MRQEGLLHAFYCALQAAYLRGAPSLLLDTLERPESFHLPVVALEFPDLTDLDKCCRRIPPLLKVLLPVLLLDLQSEARPQDTLRDGGMTSLITVISK